MSCCTVGVSAQRRDNELSGSLSPCGGWLFSEASLRLGCSGLQHIQSLGDILKEIFLPLDDSAFFMAGLGGNPFISGLRKAKLAMTLS